MKIIKKNNENNNKNQKIKNNNNINKNSITNSHFTIKSSELNKTPTFKLNSNKNPQNKLNNSIDSIKTLKDSCTVNEIINIINKKQQPKKLIDVIKTNSSQNDNNNNIHILNDKKENNNNNESYELNIVDCSDSKYYEIKDESQIKILKINSPIHTLSSNFIEKNKVNNINNYLDSNKIINSNSNSFNDSNMINNETINNVSSVNMNSIIKEKYSNKTFLSNLIDNVSFYSNSNSFENSSFIKKDNQKKNLELENNKNKFINNLIINNKLKSKIKMEENNKYEGENYETIENNNIANKIRIDKYNNLNPSKNLNLDIDNSNKIKINSIKEKFNPISLTKENNLSFCYIKNQKFDLMNDKLNFFIKKIEFLPKNQFFHRLTLNYLIKENVNLNNEDLISLLKLGKFNTYQKILNRSLNLNLTENDYYNKSISYKEWVKKFVSNKYFIDLNQSNNKFHMKKNSEVIDSINSINYEKYMSNKLRSSNKKNNFNNFNDNRYSFNKQNKSSQKLIPNKLKSAYNMIKPKKENSAQKEYLRELDDEKKLFEDF